MQGNRLYVGNLSYSVTSEELQELFSEYGEVRPLALTTFPMLGFHTRKTPIKSLADVKGLKIRSTSRLSAQLVKLLGAAPMSIAFFDHGEKTCRSDSWVV